MANDYRGPSDLAHPPGGSVDIDYSGGDQEVTVPARGFHASAAGTIKLTMLDDSTPTLTVVAGQTYPCRFKLIWQTGSSGVTGVIWY
jgi:hypothetical protein